MLLTKEQAAQVWCPRTPRTGKAGESIATCISDHCACWEWADNQRTRGQCAYKRSVIVIQQPAPAANVMPFLKGKT